MFGLLLTPTIVLLVVRMSLPVVDSILVSDRNTLIGIHAFAILIGLILAGRSTKNKDHEFLRSGAIDRLSRTYELEDGGLWSRADEALARLEAEDRGLGHWLQGVSEAERAELRSLAVDSFTKFLECWPPLRPAWRPVTESRLRAELCDGRVILDGKVDLSLGTAHGRTAGKVIVDFKTGTSLPVHREDLRFYAMVETLRIGVPPRMLSSYYLDRGYPISETVSLETLEATVARVADGVGRLIELRHGGLAREERRHIPFVRGSGDALVGDGVPQRRSQLLETNLGRGGLVGRCR